MTRPIQHFFITLVLTTLLFVNLVNATTTDESLVKFEEDYSLPIVFLNIVADVGSAQDPYAKSGLAYIAAHMLLRGTQSHKKQEFFEKINYLGGHLEVDVRNEGTVIRAGVLAENLAPFLALVHEALYKPKFTSQELSKLKKEVEGQILEQRGNDKALVTYHYARFLYGSHPYGNPVLGTLKGIKNVTPKDIVRYYTQHFSGKTLKLFGTGAANKTEISTWFTKLSDNLTAIHPEARPVTPISSPILKEGRRTLIVNKPNGTQTQVLLGGKGLRPEDKEFYPVQLANHSFGGTSFQARLMQEIRVKRGWTYGAYNTFRYGRQPKHFGMYIFPKTEDTPPAIELTLKLFEDFIKDGITRDEFDFAKSSLVNNAPFNYDTPKKRLENATTEYLMNFPEGYFKDLAKNIEEVRYSQIKPALKSFFDSKNLALTVVGDASKLKDGLSKLPGFAAPEIKNFMED